MVEFRSKRISVISALPYVNGVKHLGNITGSMLPADIFHRFLDIFGIENVFICGTDEHGTAIEIAAAEEGISPKEYSDKYYEIQKSIYEKWDFDFSFFGRSSSENNHRITQDIFLSSLENGYIKEDTIIVPYCKHDKRFLPDRYIIGACPVCGYDSARGDQCEKCSTVLDPEQLKEPKCSICKRNEIEFRKEKHLFLNLPLLEGRLKEWILQQSRWPDNTRNLALGWLSQGLKPRCITRNLKWGVQVPKKGYEHLVFYCWFDAPIAYISITKDGYEKGKIKENWKHYWKDSDIYHFIGKDNIPFHTIMWPSFLLAARDSEQRDTNFLLPYFVAGYEYLNWDGEKFSTSKGVGLFSDEALDIFPADYWRFYLASILPETKDSNFDWDDFQARINGELIANYGNLFYRATYFIEKYFGGAVPQAALGDAERQLQWQLEKAINQVKELVSQVKLREALRETLAFTSAVNKYFQDSKPWETVDTDKATAATALYTTVNLLRPISILLSPYIPASAKRALDCIGGGTELNDKFAIAPGTPVRAEILFRKIEDREIEKVKKYKTKYIREKQSFSESRKNQGHESSSEMKQPEKENASDDSISVVEKQTDAGGVIRMLPFKEFQKVDMRVGTITEVKDHPNAEKLYILKVDLGSETRQLVAGLRQKYRKEQLEGQQIIVLVNLEPREFRGFLSEGMLLAAEDGTLLEPASGVQNGARIM